MFTQLHLHFVVTGRQLSESAVARAISLSHEKYCSATAMLGRTAEISCSHEIIESDR